MELHMLGTGAGVPTKERNVTAMVMKGVDGKKACWMIDCGEGTQHQILHAPIKAGAITKVFITHLHGDHLYGLPGFLGSRSFQGADQPLTVYGPSGLRPYIEQSLAVSGTHLTYPLTVHEVEEGEIVDDGNWRISCLALDHRMPSFGYRFDEKEQPGRLDRERLLKDDIPSGPWLGDLKEQKTVTLPDGRVVDGRDYVTEPVKGRRIVILGDTRPMPAVADFAKEADLLVHEATFMAGERETADRFAHSTTLDAAEIARQADVSRLLLTHISARYKAADMAGYTEEARSRFPNTKTAADFGVYSLERGDR
ncbi:ribonuclease Z [Salisediminibacterium selenitireducens]|uniref:Ribonuclease Z n=1 Tax=Bacillus selenitireducens (strain ATCC 700615 / DSM 15326 / MLS10) TaxID=439292 RepID=D6XXC3_BACIE|nr:ribonuclease Z [Salisediminibacterium selenitireducens]ADH97980.1 ribonuclease Z [[Bacillus] selenitireducens MLS10]